jgi:hypothetical protein
LPGATALRTLENRAENNLMPHPFALVAKGWVRQGLVRRFGSPSKCRARLQPCRKAHEKLSSFLPKASAQRRRSAKYGCKLLLVNSNCQINYEISEQDYLDAQKLAIKNHPRTFTRVVYRVLPYWGLLVGLGAFWVMFAWGFHWDWLMILPLAFTVFALSRPLLCKRAVKAAYRKTRSLHGPRSTAVDEQGMSFEGPDFSSQLKWPFFLKFA